MGIAVTGMGKSFLPLALHTDLHICVGVTGLRNLVSQTHGRNSASSSLVGGSLKDSTGFFLCVDARVYGHPRRDTSEQGRMPHEAVEFIGLDLPGSGFISDDP